MANVRILGVLAVLFLGIIAGCLLFLSVNEVQKRDAGSNVGAQAVGSPDEARAGRGGAEPGVSCDASAAPTNGGAGDCTDSLASGTTCQPTCGAGFAPSGTSSCAAGILTAATCIATCDATAAPTNGGAGDCTDSLASGTTCQPTCGAGFTESGTSSCTAGMLTPATCTANPCDASTAPTNGGAGDCTESLASSTTCQPTCGAGFTESGTSSCYAGTLISATCNADPVGTSGHLAFVGPNVMCSTVGRDLTESECQTFAEKSFDTRQDESTYGWYVTDGNWNTGSYPRAFQSKNFWGGTDSSEPTKSGCVQIGEYIGNEVVLKGNANNADRTYEWFDNGAEQACPGDAYGCVCMDAATRASCDASAAPANGGSGDCTDSLDHASTCSPTCGSGFTVSGRSLCMDGVLTAATCSEDFPSGSKIRFIDAAIIASRLSSGTPATSSKCSDFGWIELSWNQCFNLGDKAITGYPFADFAGETSWNNNDQWMDDPFSYSLGHALYSDPIGQYSGCVQWQGDTTDGGPYEYQISSGVQQYPFLNFDRVEAPCSNEVVDESGIRCACLCEGC